MSVDESPNLELPVSRELFWGQMFELVTAWPRRQTDDKDFARRTYPSHQIRCITQNLKKPSSITHEVLGLRAKGIFADTIWIAIDYQTGTGISEFTHRINIRRFDKEDGRWEAWLLLLAEHGDIVLARYPETAQMTLDDGLKLIRDSEPPPAQTRPGVIRR